MAINLGAFAGLLQRWWRPDKCAQTVLICATDNGARIRSTLRTLNTNHTHIWFNATLGRDMR